MKSMFDLPKVLFLILLALGFLSSSHVRSCLLPFLFALLLAKWADPPVTRLSQRLPRWLAAILILSIAGLLICSLVLLFAVRLWQDVPQVLSSLPRGAEILPRLEVLLPYLPGGLRQGAQWILSQLRDQSGVLHTRLEAALGNWASAAAAALPRVLFTLGVTLLAAFYAAADWDRITGSIQRLLSRGWAAQLQGLGRRLKQGALGWLRVQGRLMVLHFGLLWAGLLLLHMPGALALALLTALADALPVFGSGVLLVPWSLLTLFQGNRPTAAGLLGLWLLITLSRSLLEPRFLGKQAGVSPLLTLLVLYSGLKLFGVPGLILGPIALSAVMNAADSEKNTPVRPEPGCHRNNEMI